MDTTVDTLQPAARFDAAAPDSTTRTANAATGTSRRTRTLTVAGLGALLLAAAGTSAFIYYDGRISTDDAQVDAHIAPVAPKVSGNIAEVLVDDNQAVKAGQVLLRIDPRDYEARVAQARAALAAAESQSAGANAGVPLTSATTANAAAGAEAQLAAANADLAKAKTDFDRASSSELAYATADVEAKRATADRARADLARMEPLAAKDEITRQQFDAYVAASRVAASEQRASEEKLVNAQKSAQGSGSSVQAAQARAAIAQAALDQARANRRQVDISSAQAGTASAAILQARANLDAALLQLSYATIVAPIDGVVTRKAVQIGQIVQPGQSLLTIVPLQDVWVTANFKETQLKEMRPGHRAEIRVDAYGGRTYTGKVDSIAPATGARFSLLPPDNAAGNFVKVVQRVPVRIVLDAGQDAEQVLRPGMSVTVTVITR